MRVLRRAQADARFPARIMRPLSTGSDHPRRTAANARFPRPAGRSQSTGSASPRRLGRGAERPQIGRDDLRSELRSAYAQLLVCIGAHCALDSATSGALARIGTGPVALPALLAGLLICLDCPVVPAPIRALAQQAARLAGAARSDARTRPRGGARRGAAGRSLRQKSDRPSTPGGVIAPDGERSCAPVDAGDRFGTAPRHARAIAWATKRSSQRPELVAAACTR
jgi:hypothetical protein